MGDIIFDKERTIAEKMGSFSPGEAIALGIALCKAAEAAADTATDFTSTSDVSRKIHQIRE